MNYDSGYHLLFTNPRLVEDLMRHFVPESWVASLDFQSLKRVNAKFHTEKQPHVDVAGRYAILYH